MKIHNKYDWSVIQIDYDQNGLSFRDLIEKYKMSMNAIVYAKRRGEFKSRSMSEGIKLRLKKYPRTLSEETKKKISLSRIKFLMENPDKVPYKINHSSKMSYPEKCFKEALMKNNITGWTYNYQFGIYCFDFAFTDLKIDVEIDGGTHLTEKVKIIDKRRDKFSNSKGWKIIRFTAKEVKENIVNCINILKIALMAEWRLKQSALNR